MSGAARIGLGRRGSVAGLLLLLLALAVSLWPTSARAQQSHWHGDYFPNVTLTDQSGRRLRFYDDMIRGKVVAINFIYTECTSVCPLDTAQLKRVHQILGDRVGRDIFFYSISINPGHDTPATLTRFMRTYDIGPNSGWRFLTGSRADVELLQRRLGIAAPDPDDLSGHDTSFLLGNEATGQWIKRSSFENPQNIANILGETLNNYASTVRGDAGPRQNYAAAGHVTDTSQGIYLFRTRCASCHTIGEGDRLGPDLRGVAGSRDPAWLMRWIQQPDQMIAARDPIAMGLMARYRNLPMPNLRINAQDAQALIDYLRAQDAQHAPAPANRPPRAAAH